MCLPGWGRGAPAPVWSILLVSSPQPEERLFCDTYKMAWNLGHGRGFFLDLKVRAGFASRASQRAFESPKSKRRSYTVHWNGQRHLYGMEPLKGRSMIPILVLVPLLLISVFTAISVTSPNKPGICFSTRTILIVWSVFCPVPVSRYPPCPCLTVYTL